MAGLRTDLIAIAGEAIAAVDPAILLRRVCAVRDGVLSVRNTGGWGNDDGNERQYSLSRFKSIFLCAIGKAAEPMARYILEELSIKVDDGVIITKESKVRELSGVPILLGGHPLPTAASVDSGAALTALAEHADAETLVINCISGGASALCCVPWSGGDGIDSVTLDDFRVLTQLLLDNGLSIEQSNCIRSQISEIKGGRYLQHISPGESLSLILSDVRYDNLRVIASGLTEPAHCRRAEAVQILHEYDIWQRTPSSIRAVLSVSRASKAGAGVAGATAMGADEHAVDGRNTGTAERTATQQAGNHDTDATHRRDAIIGHGSWQQRPHARNHNVIIGSNYHALQAAAISAQRRGYEPLILTDSLFGEARHAAEYAVAVAAFHLRHAPTTGATQRRCLLFGGETTVTIRGTGKGGRNQELAAAFLRLVMLDPLLRRAVSEGATENADGGDTTAAGDNATATGSGGSNSVSRSLAMISFATDGNDGPTDAAGGLVDHQTLRRATEQAGGVAAVNRALDNNDSYHLLQELGALYQSGYSATNVCDVQCVLIG